MYEVVKIRRIFSTNKNEERLECHEPGGGVYQLHVYDMFAVSNKSRGLNANALVPLPKVTKEDVFSSFLDVHLSRNQDESSVRMIYRNQTSVEQYNNYYTADPFSHKRNLMQRLIRHPKHYKTKGINCVILSVKSGYQDKLAHWHLEEDDPKITKVLSINLCLFK